MITIAKTTIPSKEVEKFTKKERKGGNRENYAWLETNVDICELLHMKYLSGTRY